MEKGSYTPVAIYIYIYSRTWLQEFSSYKVSVYLANIDTCAKRSSTFTLDVDRWLITFQGEGESLPRFFARKFASSTFIGREQFCNEVEEFENRRPIVKKVWFVRNLKSIGLFRSSFEVSGFLE